MIQHRNRTLRISLSEIVNNALADSFLSADIAASSSTITIKDIGNFAVGKYVWINPFAANSEIIPVHASTDPSGNTLTLASNTVYAHTAGETVYYVQFNQVEISHADTEDGSKSVLGTIGLLAREKIQVYLDLSETAGFYFTRFKDSVASTFGPYSDGVDYDGWEENTVGYMIEAGLREISINLSEKVTIHDCLHWVNKGLREIKGKIRKWPEHFVYDFVTGQAQRGSNVVALPTNIYDSETRRSIESVRIGDDLALMFIEPGAFDAEMDTSKKNTVRTEASSGDTTLEIDNSFDFEDSGIVHFYIANVQYSVQYTGVTRSTTSGVLTGVPASGTGSISVTVPVGTNVWQDETEGRPRFYTIRNGALEFWPLVDASRDDQNVYLDYNTAATAVDSEGDVIDYQRFGMLESYLTWRLWCKSENNGILDKSNGFYTEYKEYLNDAIRTLPPRKNKTSPNINHMKRR